MTTLSPFRICLPPSSMSRVALRRMWASGVCQRMVSETIEGIRPWSALSLSYWSRFSFKARMEPVMVLRVVSLPPTISRIRFPRYSMRSMFRVDSPWASIEIRSLRGGAFTRSFHRFMK